jgi:hypothetical protein
MNPSCDRCRTAPITVCPRCHVQLCAEHMPVGTALCHRCEAEKAAQRSALRLWPWYLIPFLLPFSYVIVNFVDLWFGREVGRGFTGHPFSNVVVLSLIVGLLMGGLATGLRIAWFNATFARSHGIQSKIRT